MEGNNGKKDLTVLKKIRNKLSDYALDGLLVSGAWNRRYVSGFTGSNGVLLITEKDAILITDYRYYEQAKKQSDFEVVLHKEHTGHKNKIFDEAAKQADRLNVKRLGFEEQHLNYASYSRLKDLVLAEMVPLHDLVEDIRMIKTSDEINKIKTASEITDQAYLHILNLLRPGLTELEVSEELQRFIKEAGGSATGFPPIVASGIRSSLPHGRATDKVIQKGEMITIDFGANYKGYWADISRTVAVGEPSGIMKEIQQAVLQSFEYCAKNLKAGMSDMEVDSLMRDVLIQRGFNELSGTGTGHGIGLEVHEKPLFSVDKEKVLLPGMTVTIEPGIYMENTGGARVEDVFLIKESGCETLTPSSKKLIVV